MTAGKEGEKKVAKKTEGAKRAVTKKPRPQIKKVIKKVLVHSVVVSEKYANMLFSFAEEGSYCCAWQAWTETAG